MYFTPDGRYAIVVAEARQHLDFRNPHTFALEHRIHVDCAGVDHIDFAATGAYLIATCEFAGRLVRVDLHTLKVAGYLNLPGSAPQDIKLDPAGRIFYVADKNHAGVWLIDAATFRRDRIHPHRPGRARPVPEPRRPLSVRDQPRQRLDHRDQLRDQEGRHHLADPRRGQPGHGRAVAGREGVLGVRAL